MCLKMVYHKYENDRGGNDGKGGGDRLIHDDMKIYILEGVGSL